MYRQSNTLEKLLAQLLFICVISFASGVYPSAQASSIATNTMTALINGVPCTMSLTSFYQLLGNVPTFTLMDNNGYPLSAITINIPFDIKAGSIYSSSTDDAYGAAGIAYSDYTRATSYSSLATTPEGDNYFGFAGGQTAWTLQIDGVNEDGSLIWGQFFAAFESTIWGTGDPTTVYDGAFCLDMKHLPAAPAVSYGAEDPFTDSTLDDLLGSFDVPEFSDPSFSGENTLCPICNGSGYKRICSLCNGLGYGTGADVLFHGAYVCASCLGEGNIICVTCGGDGRIAP